MNISDAERKARSIRMKQMRADGRIKRSYPQSMETRLKRAEALTLCVPCHFYVTYKRKMPRGSTWGQPVKLMQYM